MIWLVGLALAGTKEDLKSGERALADHDPAGAVEHYATALGPPRLKDTFRDQAWEGMLAATQQLLFVSADPALKRARQVADGWSDLAGQVADLDAAEKKTAAELVMAALNAIASANDPADAERMKGIARVLTQLDQPGLAALTVGQHQLAQGHRDAAIQTFRAAITYDRTRSCPPDIMMPTVFEALALQLWQGDRSDPEATGDVQAAIGVLEAGLKRIEEQRATHDTQDLREAGQRLTLLRLTLLAAVPSDPRTLPAFEAALREQPENVPILVTLAGVYDQLSDLDAAEKSYRRALEVEPSNTVAHFGLAAIHVNRATTLNRSAMEVADQGEATRIEAEATAIHLKAKPHFEAVLEADPEDVEALRQLLTIAYLEDDTEAVRRYRGRLGR